MNETSTSTPPPAYWWLSFVDRTDSDGETVACHLGVAIVYCAGNIPEAADEAWKHGCNPGGEVAGYRLHSLGSLPWRFVNRLLTDAADIGEAQLAIEDGLGEVS